MPNKSPRPRRAGATRPSPPRHVERLLAREGDVGRLGYREHLLDAAADLTETLLDACPGLRVLATSRQSLGEPARSFAGAPAFGARATEDVTALMRHGATQLFVERAARTFRTSG